MQDGDYLGERELEQLRKEFAIPRAKKRALGLLQKKDYTEGELREKLKKSGNDAVSLDAALQFVLSHGYVDDMQYARDYISSKKGKKSFRKIQTELVRKGISSRLIALAFEEAGEQKEEDIRPLVERYLRKFPEWNEETMQKTCASFYRKGYAVRQIRQVMEGLQKEKDTFLT